MIKALKFDMDFEVDFNAEGWEFEVCADSEQCYFNFHNGEHHTIDTMNKYDLAIVIAKNIRDDLGSWQRWSGKDLDSLLRELEHLISGPDDGEARNFTYLDKLIHGSSLEVVLDSDIVIDDGEEDKYDDGIELDVNGLVLDGNGHSIDARKAARIFACMYCSVTLKNLTLKGGFSSDWGGAIYLEEGNLRIVNCRFEENFTDGDGGAISTSGGNLTVEKSEFCSNTSNDVGGAISLEDGTVLEISSSEFRDNTALRDGGGAIFNDRSILRAFDSRFSKNRGSYGGAIYSNRELLLDGCSFASNSSRDKHCEDIDNKGILILRDSSFPDGGITVSNGFHCYISGGDEDMVENKGRIFTAAEFSDDERDFTYLDALIRENPSEVNLDYDIRLDWENGEEKKFPDGILIDTDVVIDANGHSIDARGLVRAFKCSGNVTIMNARIINGFDEKGGAILNWKGDLTILESSFEENEAYYGGALYNGGELTVKSSSFKSNRVDSIHYSEGGAIFNKYELSVECSIFKDNLSENDGGAICNEGNADISKSRFISNKAKYKGGAVYNGSKLDISDSTLKLNRAGRGGAVFQSESAEYSSANCKFRDNEPDDVFEDKKEKD
jgi:predicted outer membrane repeat protein